MCASAFATAAPGNAGAGDRGATARALAGPAALGPRKLLGVLAAAQPDVAWMVGDLLRRSGFVPPPQRPRRGHPQASPFELAVAPNDEWAFDIKDGSALAAGRAATR